MKKIITILLFIASVLTFTGCNNTSNKNSIISDSPILKLELGMEKDKVYEILGTPDVVYADGVGNVAYNDVDFDTFVFRCDEYYNDYDFGDEKVKIICKYDYYDKPAILDDVCIVFNKKTKLIDGIDEREDFIDKWTSEFEKQFGKSEIHEKTGHWTWENVCGGKFLFYVISGTSSLPVEYIPNEDCIAVINICHEDN